MKQKITKNGIATVVSNLLMQNSITASKYLEIPGRNINAETLVADVADSLDLLELILDLEDQYKVETLDEEVFRTFTTVGEIAEYLFANRRENFN